MEKNLAEVKQEIRALLAVRASPSAEAAVWSTVRRMEATRAVVRGVSDTLMEDMADLVEQGAGASEPAPKPRRGRPRKTVSNVNEGP